MRNMSFMLTTAQMYAGTKDVTRRLGWWNLKAGDVVMAVEKGMGLKKGEKVKKIYPIEIVSVRMELLTDIEYSDVVREGFPAMSIYEFIDFFKKTHGIKKHEFVYVNRIEFRRLK